MTSKGAVGWPPDGRSSLLAGLFVAGLLQSAPGPALDPRRDLTQYSLAVWRTEDGLPLDSLTAVAQDEQGRIWLGTPAGLVSFDGRAFRPATGIDQRSPADRYVTALLAPPGGGIWAATRGALFEVAQGTARRHELPSGFVGGESAALATADGDALWLAGGSGLLRFERGHVERARGEDGLSISEAVGLDVLVDARRRLWMATDHGLLLRSSAGERHFTGRDGLPSELVTAIVEDGDAVWIGTSLGLARVEGDRITIPPAAREFAGLWIRCLLRDRDGSLWIGTRGNGAYRLRGDRVEEFGAEQGLPNDLVRQIYEDRDGALWLATAGGLARLTDGPVTTWTTAQGLPGRFIWAVHEDPSSTLWVGTSGAGVARLMRDGSVAPPPFSDPSLLGVEVRAFLTDREGTLWIGTGGNGVAAVRGQRVDWPPLGESRGERWVHCLLEGRDGGLWVGTADGLVRLESGRLVARYRRQRDGSRQEVVRALAEAPDGTIWVGFADGLARLAPAPADPGRPNTPVETELSLAPVSGAGTVDSARIHAIAVEPDGALWLATDGGLVRYANGSAETWTTAHGLPVDMLYWILDDGRGELWISSDLGLLRLPKRQVDELRRGERARLEPLVLGRADGMLATECNSGAPAGARRADGTFCFATTDGVSCVDPGRVRALEEPPRIELHEILVDGATTTLPPAGTERGVEVPHGARRVELRYAAIAPVAAERVAYRYRLEGFDPAWIDAGASRSAQLTGLRSGSYQFSVAARRGRGAWSEPATLRLEIEPAVYQTYPFYVLVALAILLGISAWVQLRTRRFAQRALELERQVDQRTSELGRANAELERQSLADGLTRIANRRHFDSRLEAEWRRAARGSMPLALILADLDHFKAYNDAHGHVAGDECLKAVTAALAESVHRADDLVARYGGEEIAILLPGSHLADAIELAELLRARIEALDIRHDGSPLARITLSLGVAAVVPEPASSPAKLIDAADRALYRAKAAGRNRVAQ